MNEMKYRVFLCLTVNLFATNFTHRPSSLQQWLATGQEIHICGPSWLEPYLPARYYKTNRVQYTSSQSPVHLQPDEWSSHLLRYSGSTTQSIFKGECSGSTPTHLYYLPVAGEGGNLQTVSLTFIPRTQAVTAALIPAQNTDVKILTWRNFIYIFFNFLTQVGLFKSLWC